MKEYNFSNFRHGFGSLCSNGMRDSVSIIDEDTRKVLYPMGKYFALKNYYKNEMNCIKVLFFNIYISSIFKAVFNLLKPP